MRIYDISVPIFPGMHTYPGDTEAVVEPVAQLGRGDAFSTTRITISSHCGTHFDAPRHFLPNGKAALDIPLETFVGKAWVCELLGRKSIGRADLEHVGIPQNCERLLLKTDNAALWEKPGFQRDFVYVEPGAAEWMVKRRLKLVGVDYLSAEEFGAAAPKVHLTLLGKGIPILEGLYLKDVPPGEYTLVFLPLKVLVEDGAPGTAILLKE